MRLSLISPQNLMWVLLIFPILFSSSSLASRSSEISINCGSDNYVNTAFISNGAKLLEAIQQQLDLQKWGYGAITSPLPKVYVLAQCHSDLSHLDCKLCFRESRLKLPRCLPSNSARMYFDGCFLRYGNYSFFHEHADPRYDTVKCSPPRGVLADNFLDVNQFRNKVAEVIENVTAMALMNGTFAVTEEKQGIVPMYALAQCWGTLDRQECRKCLVMAGLKLRDCAPGPDGSALFTGCYIRYSTVRFFNNSLPPKPFFSSDTATVAEITISAVVMLALISFGAFIGYKTLSKRKEDQNNLGSSPAGSNLNFKYEVLERATDFFDESRKLGKGGAGTVFKGTLTDGRLVAVKRLVYKTRQWVDQFFNEVNLISGIKHKNLITLLGCSIEGPESLLVYEYVPNRSLDQILFVKDTIHILSWQQRFYIILGTAEGLAFLHGVSPPIIHRDIKSGNILLDEKFTPKIADFGLALCVATDDSHISTSIAGTLGYMAPEYLVRGQLTEKADVYGFGVLVIEIACGKKNSIYSQGSSSILHAVWKHYKGNTITDAIDPCLKGRFSEEEAANVLQIGLLCTQASSALRPSMAEVVQMLTNRECEIPKPKQPPFLNASVLSTNDCTGSSISKVSLTRTIINQETIAQAPLSDTQSACPTASPDRSSISEAPEKR